MLQQLVNNTLDANIITLEDDAVNNAEKLFLSLLVNNAKTSSTRVLIVCCQKSRNFYSSKVSKFIDAIDLFSDPTKWRTAVGGTLTLPSLMSAIRNESAEKEQVVFLDSINPFIWSYGITQFIRELKKLATIAKRIILRVHTDTLLYIHDARFLQDISPLHVKVVKKISSNRFLLSVTEKKIGKKVQKQAEIVNIKDDFSILSSIYMENCKQLLTQGPRMDSLTTFDLGVNKRETEIKARRELILPYLRASEESGRILYEADEHDLEEDPDEDLEL